MNTANTSTELVEALIRLRGYTRDPVEDIVYDPKHNTRIQFFLCHQDKLDMNYFYKSYERIEEMDNVTHLIFIYNVATIQIKKLKMYKDILKIEFFNENELRRLLVGNRFIPPHSQVDEETQAEIFKKFGKDHLPMILHTDPIVKLYDFDVDTVLQIERPDGLYYRLVVTDE